MEVNVKGYGEIPQIISFVLKNQDGFLFDTYCDFLKKCIIFSSLITGRENWLTTRHCTKNEVFH